MSGTRTTDVGVAVLLLASKESGHHLALCPNAEQPSAGVAADQLHAAAISLGSSC